MRRTRLAGDDIAVIQRGAPARSGFDGADHFAFQPCGDACADDALAARVAEQRTVSALRRRHRLNQLRLIHHASVCDDGGNQCHMQRCCQNAPLTDSRPSQILCAQVVDGIAGIVDNQVAEHEILVEAHLLRRLAEHFIAQILRQRGKGCVARVRERIGQALHAVCASIRYGIAADRIIARAVKGEVVQIRQVFQCGRHGHDFECRAGRIKPLRCAVDQCARGFIHQCRIHVRRVELRHGHECQNFVGLVIQHDDRAETVR